MRLFFIYILLFVTALGAFKSYSQLSDYSQFDIEDGFPTSEIYQVYEDAKGYLWMASDRGMFRFDGNNVIVYAESSGLGDGVIFRMIPFSDNKVWVATLRNEIYCFDPIAEQKGIAKANT